MRRRRVLILLVVLGWCSPALADVTNPVALRIEETSPSTFRIELVLPLRQGRPVDVKPVLPDAAVIVGEAEVRAKQGYVAQTWTVTCDRSALLGVPVGVQGLLGTALEVQLTVTMLDGRRYEKPLRPREPFAVIPLPPGLLRQVWDDGRVGFDRVVKRPELMLLILLAVLLPMRPRAIAAGLLAFAAAHAVGGWLAGQGFLVASTGLPRILAAVAVLGTVMEAGPGRRWLRPGWPVLLPIGLLTGAVGVLPTAAVTLSRSEQRLGYAFVALGIVAALALVAIAARQLRAATRNLSETVSRRIGTVVTIGAGVVACGLGLYEGSAPFFGARLAPETPAVTLLAIGVIGFHCRTTGVRTGAVLAVVALAALGAGVGLRFTIGPLPYAALVAFGGLAWIALALLHPGALPRFVGIGLTAIVALAQGNHAGGILRDGTSLPPAHAIGAIAVLAFTLLAAWRVAPNPNETDGTSLRRLAGVLGLLVAIVTGAAAHVDWLAGPVAADRAMGRLPIPLLALGLLLVAAWIWPRRRKFRGTVADRGVHWALLLAAFFLLPFGVVRVSDPFHDGAAPSPASAGRVMETLLADTYLAFNLTDEDEAIDRLERNLAPDLVADVYLDSRRRLRAGTLSGASVVVKDVDVVSVAEGRVSESGDAFTYPCSWVVTARVKHRQHIHDRQNVYVGELTIRVEGDRWTISHLSLTNEEREVLASWKR